LAVEVVMPALGRARMTGLLVRWLRREGERVVRGEPLFEVETDMAVVVVEAPGTGLLSGVRVREGEQVRAGMVVAYLLAPAARPSSAAFEPAATSPRPRVDASSGPPLSGVWRAMAESVTRGWREAPHGFLFREIDASQLVVAGTQQPDGVTGADLLLRLVAVTLRQHPTLNSGRQEVNVALAVELAAGMVHAVLHGADGLDVAALAARRAELIGRARAGRLRPEDLHGGTFALHDLGAHGVDAYLPTVTEGQTAALAAGRITDRVVPIQGRPQVRPVLALTLSCDQRAVDAARAARFLGDLAILLEEPAAEL
jgi:pyruvate dehydrogenase E2 component (dihydrolipoamide acetyltransferase)